MKSIVKKIILTALGGFFCILCGYNTGSAAPNYFNTKQIFKDSVYTSDTTFVYDSTDFNVVLSRFPSGSQPVAKVVNGDTALYFDNTIQISILKNGAVFYQKLLRRNDFAGKVFPYHVNEFLLTYAKYDSVSKNGIFINLELTKLDRSRTAVFQDMVYFNGQSSIWRIGIVSSPGKSNKGTASVTKSFNMDINQSLPKYRFNIIVDTVNDLINKIFVYKEKNKDFIQAILIPDSEAAKPPYKDVEYFSVKDFNFDGYKDIMLLQNMGATGNRKYLIWLFDTTGGKFVFNNELSSLELPGVIPEKEEVDSFERNGYGNYKYGLYKWINKRLTLIKQVIYKCKDSNTATRTEMARLNGKMIVVSERKVNCGDFEEQIK